MTLSNPFLLPVDPLVSRAFRGSFEPHVGFVKQMFMRRLVNPCADYGAAAMHKNASPSPRRFAQRKFRFSTRRQMRILIRAYFTSFRCL